MFITLDLHERWNHNLILLLQLSILITLLFALYHIVVKDAIAAICQYVAWFKERARRKRELTQQRELERQEEAERLKQEAQAQREQREAEGKAAAELRIKRLVILRKHPIFVRIRQSDGRKTNFESILIGELAVHHIPTRQWPSESHAEDIDWLEDGQLALVGTSWQTSERSIEEAYGGGWVEFTKLHCDCRVIFKPTGTPPQIIATVIHSGGDDSTGHLIAAQRVLNECLVAKAADWIIEHSRNEQPSEQG